MVLLHGWTATADLNWFACYAALAEHFNVVALDHRGHGRGLQSDEPFRLADCADDVAALVDVLGLGPVIAVGYSMGGPIAQLLWQRHPDVVAGLVLCATSCTFGGTTRETILFRVADGTAASPDACRSARSRAPPSAPSAGGGRCAASRGGGSPRSPATTGRRSSRPGASSAASTRGLDRATSTCPRPIVVTDHDDVVPVHRQLDLSAASPTPACTASAGGHSVCTREPERFLPALLDACHAVTRQPLPAAA